MKGRPAITRLPDQGILESYFGRAKADWLSREYPQILIDLGFKQKPAGVMLSCAVKEWR